MRAHSVLRPDPTTPHQPAPNDAVLLLADLVAARRVGDRAWLLEPFASPSVCPACAEAYRVANYVIAQYGGAEAWLESFEARERVLGQPPPWCRDGATLPQASGPCSFSRPFDPPRGDPTVP